MVLNTINIHNAGKTARLCLMILLLLASMPSSYVFGREQDIEKLNRFVQASDSSNAAGQTFRKGRDLIEEEQWEEAAETFGDFIDDYPKDKNVDAALYWRAFALKKQGRLQQVVENLNRLIKEYP